LKRVKQKKEFSPLRNPKEIPVKQKENPRGNSLTQSYNYCQYFISYYPKRAITLYLYMEPTITLLGLLMLFPMIVVFRYSLFDNVIMNKYSTFVGLQNYEILFSNSTF